MVRLTHLGTEEEREVLHFHYTTWPDFGVPTCPDTFLQFLGMQISKFRILNAHFEYIAKYEQTM